MERSARAATASPRARAGSTAGWCSSTSWPAGSTRSSTGSTRLLADLDVPLGAVAPVEGRPGRWICAVGTGIAFLDADGRSTGWPGPRTTPRNRAG